MDDGKSRLARRAPAPSGWRRAVGRWRGCGVGWERPTAATDRASAEATLARQLAQGGLQHNIAERLPLSQIVRAHDLVESGRVTGNVVLSVDG